MATVQLLVLPDELLLTIFYNLHARSILNCSASCHRLRAVIKKSKLLHTRICNTKHGIQELSPLRLSIPDFMENVRQWEIDWFRFKVGKKVATRSMHRPYQGLLVREPRCPTKYNFLMRSGYLIQMYQKGNPGWSHVHLNSFLPGFIKDPVWTDVRLEDHLIMDAWALDLDQDLVTASLLPTVGPVDHLEIRFIHFTTGERHKSANISAVQLEFKGLYDRHFGTHIEIMGNYLVILLGHRKFSNYQTLYLVDWIKGHVICQQRSNVYRYFPVLTSISEDTFVLGLKRDWALVLCKITKEGDSFTFCTLCKLKLPDVRYGNHVQLNNFNRAPSGPDNPTAPIRRSTLPFKNSPWESVLSFYVKVRRRTDIPTILLFYVHPSALRALAKRAVTTDPGVSGMGGLHHWLLRRTCLSPKTLPITVLWENWGPETTRWIEFQGLSVRQSLSGTRCAISDTLSGEVKLLDFNLARVRALERNATAAEILREVLVTSQSTIRAGKYFKHDIVSRLPYFQIRRRGAMGQLLIDDQWVVQAQCEPPQPLIYYSVIRSHTFWMHSVGE